MSNGGGVEKQGEKRKREIKGGVALHRRKEGAESFASRIRSEIQPVDSRRERFQMHSLGKEKKGRRDGPNSGAGKRVKEFDFDLKRQNR